MDEAQKKAEAVFAEKKAEALSFLEGRTREELLEQAANFYAGGSVAFESLGPRRPAAPLAKNEIPIPREGTSPIKEAATALNAVLGVWKEMFQGDAGEHLRSEGGETLDPVTFFAIAVVQPLLDAPETTGDAHVELMGKESDTDGLPFGIQCMVACAAYFVQTITTEKAGAWDQAWLCAAGAKYWAGVVLGAAYSKNKTGNPAAELAKARHKENYAIREFVENYWRENMDPSLSAQRAATIMIQDRVVDISQKKLAEYISALRKAEAVR